MQANFTTSKVKYFSLSFKGVFKKVLVDLYLSRLTLLFLLTRNLVT